MRGRLIPLFVLIAVIVALASVEMWHEKKAVPRMEPQQCPLVPVPSGDILIPEISSTESPENLLNEALATLALAKIESRPAFVKELISGLRSQDAEGLELVRDFFATGNDVKIRTAWQMENQGAAHAPTLRIALLNALRDWPGSEKLNAEIARTTPRPFEAVLAIGNLEKIAPGSFREEAIGILRALADQPPESEYAAESANYLIEAIQYFNAPELIPAAEKMVRQQPDAAFAFANALATFPDASAAPTYERLFREPRVAGQFSENPYLLRNLSFSNPHVVKQAARLFLRGMTREQRENILSDFGSGRDFTARSEFFILKNTRPDEEAADIQGRLDFLEQIAPEISEGELKERASSAKSELEHLRKNSAQTHLEDQKEALLPIGEGVGEAIIKGRKIQNIRMHP